MTWIMRDGEQMGIAQRGGRWDVISKGEREGDGDGGRESAGAVVYLGIHARLEDRSQARAQTAVIWVIYL